MKKKTPKPASKRSVGRPIAREDRGAYNPLPVRQIGRVAADKWARIKAGAERAGKTLTEWATDLLLAEAAKTE